MTMLLVEISMYPLRDDYIAAIDGFIAALRTAEGVEVKTNRMSTQVYGPHQQVMQLLSDAMADAEQSCVFVCKFIPGAGRSINGYD